MYSTDFTEELKTIHAKNEAAAMAVVVRREAPSSGKPGDKALIRKDGTLTGWVGGGCTKGIIIKEALEAMKENASRLVRIQPGQHALEQSGVKNYKMTCMSGGTVEVFIEPMLPKTKITIFGRSHIAKALNDIGNVAGFDFHVISDLAEKEMFEGAKKVSKLKLFLPSPSPNDFVVVCTQGEDDANSLWAALQCKPRYLAFVASKRKADAVMAELRTKGVSEDELAKVKTPAGLDIAAKTHAEVAISILAEIINEKRSGKPVEIEMGSHTAKNQPSDTEISEDIYINPVCNVPVMKSSAKHIIEHKGEKVYFCCDGCKVSFEKEPEAYITV